MKKVKQKQLVSAQHPLQVRVPAPVREALADAAKAAGRSLSGEICRRLEASLTPLPATVPDALIYGWSNPGRAQSLGVALGLLAGQIEDLASGPSETPWQPGVYGWARVGGREYEPGVKLALLKLAITRVLDGLGASTELSRDQTRFADLVAHQFVGEFQRCDPNPQAYSQRADIAALASLKSHLTISDTQTYLNKKE